MSGDWKKRIICQIYKKSDKLLCNNLSGISLLCVLYKQHTNNRHRKCYYTLKGKAFPLQAQRGPQGGQRYSSTLP